VGTVGVGGFEVMFCFLFGWVWCVGVLLICARCLRVFRFRDRVRKHARVLAKPTALVVGKKSFFGGWGCGVVAGFWGFGEGVARARVGGKEHRCGGGRGGRKSGVTTIGWWEGGLVVFQGMVARVCGPGKTTETEILLGEVQLGANPWGEGGG